MNFLANPIFIHSKEMHIGIVIENKKDIILLNGQIKIFNKFDKWTLGDPFYFGVDSSLKDLESEGRRQGSSLREKQG